MRIGINVPDKVIKLIKKLDPEANISQICRRSTDFLHHRPRTCQN